MPTFTEISADYAQKLQAAIRKDSFTKSASLSETVVRYSATARALKDISTALDNDWKVGDEPLTQEQKDRITTGIAEELGIQETVIIQRAVKASSNDSYLQLVSDIGQILRSKTK